jgi:hypothetical protein
MQIRHFLLKQAHIFKGKVFGLLAEFYYGIEAEKNIFMFSRQLRLYL